MRATQIETTFDVAVIGGGIQGAGVAQAASAAGYKTLIIEKADWGSGTSCKSSKLIHGGLRYLESGQLSLVWSSLKERNILLKVAPSLVKPLKFTIPIYTFTQRRSWQLYFGLSIYSLLSGIKLISRFKIINAEKYNQAPLLLSRKLQRLFTYWDAQTDDQALTRSVIHSAQKLGATTLAPAELIKAIKTNNGYQLKINQELNGETISRDLQCRFLVNASGPWINDIANKIDPVPKKLNIEQVKGSHIIISGKINESGFYLESPQDQRAVFVLPWNENTLVGTTEKLFIGDPTNIAPSPEEVEYLLKTVSHYFPTLPLKIIDQFAGVRVLPSGNSSLFSRPRECILHREKQHPHLISLYGGKLTGYRHNGEKVLRQIKKVLGKKRAIADTSKLLLSLPK
jgi:glycerol-3-phosphate dehydrogenase